MKHMTKFPLGFSSSQIWDSHRHGHVGIREWRRGYACAAAMGQVAPFYTEEERVGCMNKSSYLNSSKDKKELK